MQFPYELWIGWRYVRAKRKTLNGNRFISFISGLSAAGIALGVAALIIVISVMNGFQREVRDRMLSVIPHVEVFSADGPIDDWRAVAAKTAGVAGVKGVAPTVTGQAMVTRADVLKGVMVRGVLPEDEGKVSDLPGQMRRGSLNELKPGGFGVVVGRNLANSLGLQMGDKVTVMPPTGTATPAGLFVGAKAFTLVGVFDSGSYEYDSGMVIMHVSDAALLFRTGGVTGLRVKTTDMNNAPEFAQRIGKVLAPNLEARDWSRENAVWFGAVQVERRMMFLILTLIVAVAAFNLVSMLVMTVTDKRSDIAILRTLGAQPNSVQKIFVVQGAMIGWLGTMIGLFFGLLIAFNVGTIVKTLERTFGFKALPESLYLISYMPSEVRFADVLTIAITSLIFSFLATLYPSRTAAKIAPAAALRYE
jgi:lipoprotein-releasing system permease protein